MDRAQAAPALLLRQGRVPSLPVGPARLLRLSRHAAGALWSQKGKAFLMMLGTAVGIMLLTAVVGLSEGVEKRIQGIMASFGPRSVVVFAGGGRIEGPRSDSSSTLKPEDAAAVRARFADRAVLAAGLFRPGVNVKWGDQSVQTTVVAADPNYPQAFDWYPSSGDPLDVDDERSFGRVCLLGATVARNLFGDLDPVGQRILLNRVQFRVKGVLAPKGTSAMGFDMDDRIWIPLSTGMRRVFHVDSLSFLRLQVREGYEVSAVVEELTDLLRTRHRIVPPEEDDFRVRTPDFIAQRIRSMSRTTQLVGAALAAVALLVGGVVLMNILLLSVSERVPEIGLKRALGARQTDIFAEFLAESVLVSLLGMALGVLLGLLPVWLVPAFFPTIPMSVTWKTFAFAVAFSSLVGAVFGVQPARRAARLDPVTALR
jgi:putative ABC transport system permease protein